MLGESTQELASHVEIEANIDDMNPQFYAAVMAHLFAGGALDVYFTPIQMKKNRPGTKLSVIAAEKDEAALAQLILRETSTLGVRSHPLTRFEADREFSKVATPYGEIAVKLKKLNGKVVQAAPEYEDCAAAAERAGVPLPEVYRAAEFAARSFLTEEAR